MNKLITLIIIVHNRYRNVERLLKYYQDFLSPVIIADSSEKKYEYQSSTLALHHIYTPGLTFTEKIDHVLQYVQTPYVAMCADDDFIIPSALLQCVSFLEKNKDYSVAQGTCLMFKKEENYRNGVEFGLLYPLKSYDIEHQKPILRLEHMFQNYRSILYAVHRTDILKISFKNAGEVIKNLFLNEYLTAFLPIVSGKYKELPIAYQAREFSDFSDDKITVNLDTLIADKKYQIELQEFINLTGQQVSLATKMPFEETKKQIIVIIKNFSKSPLLGKISQPPSFKKKLGTLICNIPFLGKWIISKNRQLEKLYILKKTIRTKEEKENLIEIQKILKRYP